MPDEEDYMNFPLNEVCDVQQDTDPGRDGEPIDIMQGLKEPIVQKDPNNKGLQMMQKMGFQLGESLGLDGGTKRETPESSSPIVVTIKKGRAGLGLDEELSREASREIQKHQDHLDQLRMAFEAKTSRTARNRKMKSSLLDALSSISSLCQRDLDESEKPKTDSALQQVFLTMHESLNVGVSRTSSDNSPGTATKSSDFDSEIKRLSSLSLEDQLSEAVKYLRTTYTYCFWCGTLFENDEDLRQNCPGTQEDDH